MTTCIRCKNDKPASAFPDAKASFPQCAECVQIYHAAQARRKHEDGRAGDRMLGRVLLIIVLFYAGLLMFSKPGSSVGGDHDGEVSCHYGTC